MKALLIIQVSDVASVQEPFLVENLHVFFVVFEIAHEYVTTLYADLSNSVLIGIIDFYFGPRECSTILVERDIREFLISYCSSRLCQAEN